MKDNRMKRQFLQHRLLRSAVMVALAGLAWAPSQLLAQEKGAARLMDLMRPPAAPTIPAASPRTMPMSCPKCQDVVKRAPDRNAKGAELLLPGGSATTSVVQHLCESCSTTVTTVGHGKAKQDIAQHTCTACGAASKSCCSTVAHGKPTPGM